MKTILFFVLCAIVSSAKAQTLKDALFSGRLKTDSGTVVKKSDSLKLLTDSLLKIKKDSLAKETVQKDPHKIKSVDTTSTNPVTNPVTDNNKTWKQFVDEYTGIIKKDVLPSKKIKEGTYSVLIEYEIGLDGTVTTTNVYCTPENSYLVEQIKTRMMMNAPQLTPLLMSNGKPRKALKKQSLIFVKGKD